MVIASCAVALAGCGTSASRPERKSVIARSTSTSTSTSSTAPKGEASKTPQQILMDAAAALRAAHGYELRGTVVQGNQSMRLQLLADSSLSVKMAATIGADTYEVIGTTSGFYVRANAAFWTAHVGARARLLANHWIHTPESTGLAELGNFAPATVARCLTEDHGTLSIAGKATVGGQAAVVLKDAGDLPGSQPGTLAVAASGPPVPLRVTSTGRQRPGGHIDVCNDGKADSAGGVLSFSHFNHLQSIQPPRTAIQLPGGATA